MGALSSGSDPGVQSCAVTPFLASLTRQELVNSGPSEDVRKENGGCNRSWHRDPACDVFPPRNCKVSSIGTQYDQTQVRTPSPYSDSTTGHLGNSCLSTKV